MKRPPALAVRRPSRLRFALVGGMIAAWLVSCAARAESPPDAEPRVIAVGKGSYAEFPPLEDAKLKAFLEAKVHVDPAMKGRPLPTNKWWTDLLNKGFSGNLWAYPLVIQAVPGGVQVYFPTTWNADGHTMDKGDPILISGTVKPVAGTSMTVLADFEGDRYPEGWQTEGTAFGDGPAPGALPGETPVSGYLGTHLASSFHSGDGATGTLSSPEFIINQPFLHFMIAGGRQPDALYLALEIDGKIVRQETGDDSEQLKWKTWDVTEFVGRQAQLVAVDKATGGWGHLLLDQIVASSESKPPSAGSPNDFAPTDATAADWGDWTLKMRLKQDETRVMDATFGRGLPYVWLEIKGIEPKLEPAVGATVLDDHGQPLTLPVTARHIVIRQQDRLFAVFAPDGTVWKNEGTTILAQGANGPLPYLILAGLPDITQIDLFTQHAYAIPRQSLFDWTYDSVKAQVQTTWKIKTEALQGSNLDTIQGWLPHQYRDTTQSLAFVPPEFATPRGKMRCAVGQTFAIAWPFDGLPPLPPAPKELTGVAHPFQSQRMKDYLAAYVTEHAAKSGKERYGADTYWGGKDLLQYALYANIAHQSNDDTDYQALLGLARDALADWYTYTPGEPSQYFARYENWKALIGFKPSYGSENFTDNHFHYGYFTLATALVGLDDPQFLQDYGPMAKLVARQYANWDRTDLNFPYLRTFDPWAGHSYAGGMSSGDGNNQESSSEAMQSWGGLFLLGVVLQDKDMTAAGAMGWSIEESAVREYWNDYHGWKDGPAQANFPPNYGHTIAGIVGDNGMSYGTFFNGEPRYIYGIQWLPLSTSLYYLGRDPAFAKYQLDSMMKDQTRVDPPFTFSKLGDDWGDVTLGYKQFSDPDGAAAQFDGLWDANDPIARGKNIAGLTYYFIHADRQLGPVAWDYHTDLPGSLVFHRAGDDHLTVVAWSAAAGNTTCQVYQGDKVVGTVTIPGRALTSVAVPLPKP